MRCEKNVDDEVLVHVVSELRIRKKILLTKQFFSCTNRSCFYLQQHVKE